MRITVLSLLLLVGCASIEKHPIEIECSGKGTITGTGYGAASGIGGANTFTIQADCNDGFSFKSGPPK